MTSEKDNSLIGFGVRKTLLYYLGFCILFLIIHLSLISLVSFFHFLLEHDMGVIENWLYRNAWEIIIFAKLIAAFIIVKALKLNNYFVSSFFQILKTDEWKPERKAIVLIIFLSVLFYALIIQFGGGINNNTKSTEFAHISYIGSCLFYFIDFIVVNILVRNIEIDSKRKFIFLFSTIVLLFLLFTKATLPYISKYFIFLILHYSTLLFFLFKQRTNMANPILYALVIIGPFSSFYGLDIVWDNAHSLYSYKENLPLFGIMGIWLIGIVYYFRKS